VQKPRTWDIDELIKKMPLEERLYRHRCVEAWYMDVPWMGFPLRLLLEAAQPLAKARYVRFVSFIKKEEARGQKEYHWYRWPYYEGLTLAEAMNELTFATIGIYGHELPKQNGAPLRVVVPWKYGYKGPKSVVRIELAESQPATFWNDLQPLEYSFESNVNPAVPHPRWSQASERSIDGARSRSTRLYNGYAPWVGQLYEA
jgi:sulfoxide reductase catalytic subunit YedY